MKYDSGKLEGGYRLAYIHRTKRYLFMAEAAIILIFTIYLLVVEGGFSLRPFFLSINSFIYFVLIMLLVIALESFVFTILEMRFMSSDSARFITTQRAFRSSLLWIFVSLLVILLLWAPILPEMVDDEMGSGGGLEASSSSEPTVASFFNTDPLGLTEVDVITFQANGLVEVFILNEENYERFESSGKEVLGGYRVNPEYEVRPELAVDFPATTHGRFYILAYSVDGTPVDVEYSMTQRVSPSMVTYLPVMALLFLAAYSIWAVYNFVQNKRYVKGIYR
ncbi:MAG: hypothetical protein JXA45_01760 [Methanomassiliicoccales archaeon]|nr:hypothetical protein [Methanomassiliicoccales archaeon]